MAEEKIFKDEILSDDELDNVAGGKFDPNNPEDMEKVKNLLQKLAPKIDDIIKLFNGSK